MKINLQPEEQHQFEYIKFNHKNKPIKGHFPDFLIVGPQRTGTTWLSENLRLHNEIFFSFPKELYFFNRLNLPENKYSRHFYALNSKLLTKNFKAYLSEIAKIFYFDFYKTGFYQANQLEWYLHFFSDNYFEKRTKEKFMQQQFGLNYEPKVRGEATASYAALDPGIIKEIALLNPDLKILLMIRNPVDRAWSHSKKKLVRAALDKTQKVEDAEFYEFFKNEYQLRCGQYSVQINNWKKVLKPGHLFLGSYAMVEKDPKQILLDIFDFLNINVDERFISKKATEVINPTGSEKIPQEYRQFLENLFKEEVELFKRDFGIDINHQAFRRIII